MGNLLKFSLWLIAVNIFATCAGMPTETELLPAEIPKDPADTPEALLPGYFPDKEGVGAELEAVLEKEKGLPLDILLKDFKEWSRTTYKNQMSAEPNEDELEDYMFDVSLLGNYRISESAMNALVVYCFLCWCLFAVAICFAFRTRQQSLSEYTAKLYQTQPLQKANFVKI